MRVTSLPRLPAICGVRLQRGNLPHLVRAVLRGMDIAAPFDLCEPGLRGMAQNLFGRKRTK